jgi:putative transposon-encoded protein
MAKLFLNSKKMQMKSKNYEICQDVMISYMKVVVKIWEGFEHVAKYDV